MLPYELNKLNLLNKQCFYRKFRIIKCYAVSTVTTCIWMLSFGIDTAPQSLVYCPADYTLFEVSPEICCSGVLSRYCCYFEHAAGSKPI